jgi:hypothetical protein
VWTVCNLLGDPLATGDAKTVPEAREAAGLARSHLDRELRTKSV